MTAQSDWRQIVGELSKYRNPQTLHPYYLFRGQACDTWSLESSFARIANRRGLDRTKSLQLERETVNKFSISASKLLPLELTIDLTLSRFKSQDSGAIDFLGWFVLMQHFGAPTRTLDWAVSPWVALYFACCAEDGVDGAIWVADFSKVTSYCEAKMGNSQDFASLSTQPDSPELLAFMHSRNTNPRIEAQQARFSICTNPLSDHLALFKEAKAIEKIQIPQELKASAMIELSLMNISAQTLFPGADGLGKSISDYCKLWDESSIIK